MDVKTINAITTESCRFCLICSKCETNNGKLNILFHHAEKCTNKFNILIHVGLFLGFVLIEDTRFNINNEHFTCICTLFI